MKCNYCARMKQCRFPKGAAALNTLVEYAYIEIMDVECTMYSECTDDGYGDALGTYKRGRDIVLTGGGNEIHAGR